MKKSIVISSVAVFAVVALTGCTNTGEQALDDAANKTEDAKQEVQKANENYVENVKEVEEAKMDAKQDTSDTVKDNVKDVAEAKVDATKDTMEQDAKALQAVADAAGAKITVAILQKMMNTAANSVGTAAVATSIDSTNKNGTAFVVEVTSVGDVQTEVYLDENGKVIPSA